MGLKFREPVWIEIERIHPNDWNPNSQSDFTFNELSKEILEDGFDQPIQVVPLKDHPLSKVTMQYRIIGGEHRWRIVKAAGEPKIPCIVYEDWDEATQKLKTVRRNLVTGSLDSRKFTELVRDMENQHNFSKDELYRMMGFETQEEMSKYIIEDKDKKDKAWLDSLASESTKETDAVESLSEILNTIFREAGDTLDKNYMFFTYKGKLQLLCLLDGDSHKITQDMVQYLRDNDVNINEFLKEAIGAKLKKVGIGEDGL